MHTQIHVHTHIIIWSMPICGALSIFTTCCQLSLFWAPLQALFSLKFPGSR